MFDVDFSMRGISDAVDAEEGFCAGMDERGEGLDVVDCAEDVGCVGACNEDGLVTE